MSNTNDSGLIQKYLPLNVEIKSDYDRSYWFSVILVELTVIGLAILCYAHAFQQGIFHLVALTTAIIFGLIVEYVYITHMQGRYTYGPFLLMVQNILPISIGVSWGVIVYTVINVTTMLNIPWLVAPFIDALLAICLDSFMDPIAVSIGMWRWHDSKEKHWFNVPVINYYGWFWIVFSFSFFWRLFTNFPSLTENINVIIGANLAIILASFLVLLLSRKLHFFLREGCRISNEKIMVGIFAICIIVSVMWVRPNQLLSDPILLIIPAIYSLLIIAILFISNSKLRPKRIFVGLALLTNILFWMPFMIIH